MTDVQLAFLTGLPRMTIFNARRGKNITLRTAQLIAGALGEPLESIWPNQSQEKVA